MTLRATVAVLVSLLAVSLAIVLVICEPVAAQTRLVVNSTAHPGDGLCDEAQCTLLEAMEEANTLVGVDTILFAIEGDGPHTIQPNPWLPIIEDAVVIDGYSQPGAAPAMAGNPASIQIEINGSTAAVDVHGIEIETDNSWIRGLAVNRFARGGILIIGSNNVVEGCYLGTSVDGSAALGNGYDSDDGFSYDGIWLAQGSGNRIGGSDPSQANLVSGNANAGAYVGAPNNLIEGNLIGTDVAGTAALPNEGPGIAVFGGNRNTIRGNLVSGNGWYGVDIFDADDASGPVENVVVGNTIGTSADGMSRLGNAAGGILINGSENIVGGTAPVDRNLVSGNLGSGVVIFDPEGALTAARNRVIGNWIGLNSAGADTLGNLGTGVRLVGAGNIVGGPEVGMRNVISGNLFAGISIRADESPDSVGGNVVQGNWLGSDATGKNPLGNIEDGVAILGSKDNQVLDNLMVDNFGGVFIVQPAAERNTVSGNLIGTDEDGTGGLSNFDWGVDILEGAGNTVSRNVIALNRSGGVNVTNARPAGKRARRYGSRIISVSNGRGGYRRAPASAPLEAVRMVASKSILAAGEGNRIVENRIFGNGAIGIDNGTLGIDLGQDGRSINDNGDPDEGPNRLQNGPQLTGATAGSGSLTIAFSVATDPASATYPLAIHVYVADDLSQGSDFLGEVTYAESDAGDSVEAILTLDAGVEIPDEAEIVATATDGGGNTSEFSSPVTVGAPPVSIGDEDLPSDGFALGQSFPNPIPGDGPGARIRYELGSPSVVWLVVYDPLGREVARPVDAEATPAGAHEVTFDVGRLPSGVYSYVLRAGDRRLTRQMTVIR